MGVLGAVTGTVDMKALHPLKCGDSVGSVLLAWEPSVTLHC